MDIARAFAKAGAPRFVDRVKSFWSTWSATGNAAVANGNNFDGLRLVAALLIVYGHQGQLTGHFDLSGTGSMRTLAFFSISGFLVAGSWLADPHAGRFLLRRFLRVWPAYALMILVCAAFAYIFAASNLHRLAAMFYLNNLYFYGFDWGFFKGPWPLMNMSMWTMPMEVSCYLVMAAIGLLGNRAITAAAVAVALYTAFKFGARAPFAHDIAAADWDSTWTLYFGGFFSVGILLRQLAREWLNVALIACALLGTVFLFVGARSVGLLFIIPAAMVWIGLRSWPVLRAASRYGDLSLGVFLWAWPVQQVTMLWLGFSQPVWMQLVVVLPQVLIVAWLTRRFVELPVMRFKPRRPSRPSSGNWRTAIVSQVGQSALEIRSFALWARTRLPRRLVAVYAVPPRCDRADATRCANQSGSTSRAFERNCW